MEPRAPSLGSRVAVVTGFVLLLGVGFLILVSGLIMPAGAVVGLAVVWAVAVAAAARWRRRPTVVLLIPVLILAIWAATAWVGDTFFGWTA